MVWNEFARVGAKLQDAFWNHKYTEKGQLDDASFVFDILDKIHIEDGYSLKIVVANNRGIGDVSKLIVLSNDMKEDPTGMYIENKYDPTPHIIVEPTEMGVFQAQLLKFADCWMPVFWHGGYNKRTFMFCEDNLYSENNKSSWNGSNNFKASAFINDERINPIVKIDGENVDIICCYWSDWGGLIRTRFSGILKDNRLLPAEHEDFDDDEENDTRHEVLFTYDCGILF